MKPRMASVELGIRLVNCKLTDGAGKINDILRAPKGARKTVSSLYSVMIKKIASYKEEVIVKIWSDILRRVAHQFYRDSKTKPNV